MMHLLNFVILAVAASGLAAPVHTVTDSVGSITTVSIPSAAPTPAATILSSSGRITSIITSQPHMARGVSSVPTPVTLTRVATPPTSGTPSIVRASGPITTLPAVHSHGAGVARADAVPVKESGRTAPTAILGNLVDELAAPLGARQLVPPTSESSVPCVETVSSAASAVPSVSGVPMPAKIGRRMLPAKLDALVSGTGRVGIIKREISSVTLPGAPTTVTRVVSVSSPPTVVTSIVPRSVVVPTTAVADTRVVPSGLPTGVRAGEVVSSVSAVGPTVSGVHTQI